jgi:ATP-dependent Clp protease protease subunit
MPKPISFDPNAVNRSVPPGVKAARTPTFSAENKAGDLTIRIYDVVGPDWMGMIGAETVARALDEAGEVKSIDARINSPGGDVWEGLAIYNQLVQHAAKVKVTIDGLAASIASVIAMAGDEVRIAKNSQFMIHKPAGLLFGTSDELRQWADVLDTIQESITGIYSDRTKQSAENLKEWIDAETWMTAEQAVERGFADSLVENKSKDSSAKNESDGEATLKLLARRQATRMSSLELAAIEAGIC